MFEGDLHDVLRPPYLDHAQEIPIPLSLYSSQHSINTLKNTRRTYARHLPTPICANGFLYENSFPSLCSDLSSQSVTLSSTTSRKVLHTTCLLTVSMTTSGSGSSSKSSSSSSSPDRASRIASATSSRREKSWKNCNASSMVKDCQRYEVSFGQLFRRLK